MPMMKVPILILILLGSLTIHLIAQFNPVSEELSEKYKSEGEAAFYFEPLYNNLQQAAEEPPSTKRHQRMFVMPSKIYLPDEAGESIEYIVTESTMLSIEMQAQYPDFKTYILTHSGEGYYAGRIFMSRFGLEGMVKVNGKHIRLEPLDKLNPILHKAYIIKNAADITCGLEEIQGFTSTENNLSLANRSALLPPLSNGSLRRIYDLALVTTGEFYQSANFGNNNAAQSMAAVVNIVNLLNITYNAELAIHFNLADSPYFYTNPSTDPFIPTQSDLLNQAGNAINAQFQLSAYDVGFVFHATASGGSGIAELSATCKTSVTGVQHPKSRGWSGGNTQLKLALDILLHEMGHMFGAKHTFNGTGGNCTATISALDAVEIGSGTTLMAYKGNCQTDNNIIAPQDYTFHAWSVESILQYLSEAGGTCASVAATSNTAPVVNANPCNGTYTIPKLTPFTIMGTATDVESSADDLTYSWQQIDEDGIGTPTQGYLGTTAGNSTLAPLFRSYYPAILGNTRTFPTLNTILTSANVSTFEPLPNIARTLHFRLSARDNHPVNGGIGFGDLTVSVNGSAGPLRVTAPNTLVTWSSSSIQTITWDVNNTDNLFASVDILLSIDEGQSFPYTLATGTPNDGSHTLTLPMVPATTRARIKIRYRTNSCFEVFDVSDINFTISSSCLVKASTICSDAPLICNTCSAELRLDMKKSYIDNLSNIFTGTMTATDLIAPRAVANAQGSMVCQAVDTRRMKTYGFMVNVAGTYQFNINSAIFTAMSIFTGFKSDNPCNSTSFVGSNGFVNASNGVSISSTTSINLVPCVEYTIAIFQTTVGNPSFTITASGPDALLMIGADPIAGYDAYTYVAINQTNQILLKYDDNADFTNVNGGNFNVKGINYQDGLTPSSWMGQNINTIIANNCALPSSNAKLLKVSSCFDHSVKIIRANNKKRTKKKSINN